MGPTQLTPCSIPFTVLLYNGPLLCGFNVAIKWLTLVNTSALILYLDFGAL